MTGTVVIEQQPVEGVQLTLDGHRVDPTDEQGRFVLENVGKGDHKLVLRRVGTWPRKPYKFSVGKSDKNVGKLALQPLVVPRFTYDQGNPAQTVRYQAHVWLLGRPAALKRVKSVLYELPVWIGKPPATGAVQQPFCYATTGQVDFGFLGQHSGDPVIATVNLRSGDRFKVVGFPNPAGEAPPQNCPLNGSSAVSRGGGGGGPSGGGGSGGGGGGGGSTGGGGVTYRIVPNVVGKSFENAFSELARSGFGVVRIDVESDDAQGVVVDQSPRGRTSQPLRTRITLKVSKGPITVVTVPDVTNASQADATVKLQDNNFKVHPVTQAVSDPSQDGVVVTQDPPGGTQAKFGSTVTINVGKFQP